MSADSGSGFSRRQMIAAGATGLIAADGTPEQIHLTWSDDPTRTVVVSWASPGRAERPRVRLGQRVIAAAERAHTDPRGGAVTWTYHARVDGLRPGATYGYAVTADNDTSGADPFSATFTTAPQGRAAFRFTSFGDLGAPSPPGAGSRRTFDSIASPSDDLRRVRGGFPLGDNGQGAYAVGAVETFQPLFHLLNGDLAHADLGPGAHDPATRARAWRDFGNNVQASAANRPWLPAPADHDVQPGDGEPGLASYLARYTLPPNGVDGFAGRWYAFRVGTALFVCLSGDDVAYSSSRRGFSGGAQTRWLESTLAAARADASVDWIVVQLHQCACSSAAGGSRSDLGVRREWLPLFDAFEVDLVLSGHDYGYERSFPVRGFGPDAGAGGAAAGTGRPRPVTTVDSGVFDTSQGTVHLVLGCGGPPGDSGPGDSGPGDRARGDSARGDSGPGAAVWSARRDTSSGYGIAVFDVSPGSETGGQTSITVRYYHAVGPEPADAGPAGAGPVGLAATGTLGAPTGDYTIFETFTLVRPRSDGRRWHPKG
ncbi:MAG: purple acid phosphatase family protein [Trebonia sp.]